ncbi:P-loop containing nucleoside triphosphate hydrolase protein [Cristinia sonorae]|uniref:P-loop containing nucleoside triphosphate hydrolase protein n=1 Tax=Cristinia sonorae TaxID=1940300 RepID=A0A8K0UGG5_9AGAR|nr:P-loop containing nucleoside triphosphate hydrolase protein [Cristinia sonorae]
MDGRPLSTLKLPPATQSALMRAGYATVADVLATPAEALAKELNISLAATQTIYSASQAQRAAPMTQSAAVLVGGNSKRLTTLSRPLDAILDGGIQRGSILEISGAPGSLKETLAERIALSFVEENEEVLFVDMQNMSGVDKLKECFNKSSDLPPQHERLVHFLSLQTLSDVMIFLGQLHEFLTSHPKTSLLVLNSLSFPFQSSVGFPHSTRNALLERTKTSLAKACASGALTVIITTQLATKMLNADGTSANFDTGSRAVLLPQLGSSYLPNGKTYRVMIVPHSPTSGVLRLLSSPLHVQAQNKQPVRDEPYEIIEGVMQ